MAKLSRTAFARLISYLSHNTGIEFAEFDIENIDAMITFEEPAKLSDILPAPKASAVDVDSLLAAFKDDNKIEVIKAYRTLTGYGLKESKAAVDSYWVSKPRVTAPEFKHKVLDSTYDYQGSGHILRSFLPDEVLTIRDFVQSFDAGD